jgi:hypothetical protein
MGACGATEELTDLAGISVNLFVVKQSIRYSVAVSKIE